MKIKERHIKRFEAFIQNTKDPNEKDQPKKNKQKQPDEEETQPDEDDETQDTSEDESDPIEELKTLKQEKNKLQKWKYIT